MDFDMQWLSGAGSTLGVITAVAGLIKGILWWRGRREERKTATIQAQAQISVAQADVDKTREQGATAVVPQLMSMSEKLSAEMDEMRGALERQREQGELLRRQGELLREELHEAESKTEELRKDLTRALRTLRRLFEIAQEITTTCKDACPLLISLREAEESSEDTPSSYSITAR